MAKYNPAKRGLDEQELEGGGRGAGGASALEAVTKVGGPATLAFLGGIGGSEVIKNAREKREAKAEAEAEAKNEMKRETRGMKKGGKVSSASSRADGCAVKGKTKGRMV